LGRKTYRHLAFFAVRVAGGVVQIRTKTAHSPEGSTSKLSPILNQSFINQTSKFLASIFQVNEKRKVVTNRVFQNP